MKEEEEAALIPDPRGEKAEEVGMTIIVTIPTVNSRRFLKWQVGQTCHLYEFVWSGIDNWYRFGKY
jgi:hypothetical protein